MFFKKNFIKSCPHFFLFFAIIALCAYQYSTFDFIFKGYVWDFFDSAIPIYKYQINNDSAIFHIIGNNPRQLFYSDFHFLTIIFKIFGINYGLFVVVFLQKLIAFYGTFYLISSISKNCPLNLKILLSFTYTFMPFWEMAGLSVHGLPLLFYNIAKYFKSKKYFVYLLFPFLYILSSFFYLTGFFVIGYLVCFSIYSFFFDSSKFIKSLALLGIFIFGYLFVDFELYLYLYNNGLVTNRIERIMIEDFSWLSFFKTLSVRLSFNQEHAMFPVTSLLIVNFFLIFDKLFTNYKYLKFTIFLFAIVIFYPISNDHLNIQWLLYLIISFFSLTLFTIFHLRQKNHFALFLLLSFLGVQLFSILLKYKFFDFIYIIPFQWDRIYFLSPFILFLYFIYILLKRYPEISSFSRSCLFSFLLVICVLETFNPIENHIKNEKISIKYFYDYDINNEISELIDEDKYFIHVGVIPAFSIFYGRKTIDGYWPNYLLENKIIFRRIVQEQLDGNPAFKKYFNDWGNRCYLTHIGNPDDLRLNLRYFYDVGGKYVLSKFSLKNNIDNNVELSLIKHFKRPENYYKNLYLYEIKIK